MNNVLITGATGFAGSYLIEHLLDRQNYNVFGTYLSEDSLINISGVNDKISLHKVDLLDSAQTDKLIQDARPDIVFHLAALAATGDSYKNPAEVISNNISSQVNILEAIKKADISPRVLVVSSAEVY